MSRKLRTFVNRTFEDFLIQSTRPSSYRHILNHTTENSLISGHYPLNQFGSPFKRRLNRCLSRILPSVWGSLLQDKLQSIYYDRLFPVIEKQLSLEDREINRYVFHTFLEVLQRNITRVRYLSPISLFHILSDIIYHPNIVKTDIYHEVKIYQNRICYELLEEVANEISHSDFQVTLFLVTRSNWIDSFYLTDFTTILKDEVCTFLDQKTMFNDFFKHIPKKHLSTTRKLIEQSTTILYECDNSGEVIFDLFLICNLIKEGKTIYICGKTSSILNDVTAKEIHNLISLPLFSILAKQLNKTFFIISAQSRVIGKKLHAVGKDYFKAYNKANCIILKGQGNFESMPIGPAYQKPIIYICGIKSEEIQQSISSSIGTNYNIETCFIYPNLVKGHIRS